MVNEMAPQLMSGRKKQRHPFKIAAGARLRAVRHVLRLSQEALAAQLHVSRSAYAGYEQGERLVDPEVVVRLNRLYGITTDWIYRGSLAGLPDDLRAALAEYLSAHPETLEIPQSV